MHKIAFLIAFSNKYNNASTKPIYYSKMNNIKDYLNGIFKYYYLWRNNAKKYKEIYNYSKFFNMLCNPIVLVRNLSFFGQFFIVSPHYIMGKGGRLFDETYINGVEDVEVFLDVLSNGYYRPTHFKIRHLIGTSLGRDEREYGEITLI